MSQRRKTKRERFQTTARKRLERACGALKRLERCANRANYDYTDDEAQQLLAILDGRVKRLQVLFEPEPKFDF